MTGVARTPINQLSVSHCSAKMASRTRKPMTAVNISHSRVDIASLHLPPMGCSVALIVRLDACGLVIEAGAVELDALGFVSECLLAGS